LYKRLRKIPDAVKRVVLEWESTHVRQMNEPSIIPSILAALDAQEGTDD